MGIAEKILPLAFAAGIAIQAQGVVDVHSHILPTEYIASLERHNALLDEGFPLPKYDAETHLKWMDEAGVGVSVLTMAAPQPSFGDAKETTLTAQCRACPHLRFCGGGCLKDRFGVSTDGQPGQYWLCPGLKTFFSHAEPILEQVMAMSAAGKNPREIMAALVREQSEDRG